MSEENKEVQPVSGLVVLLKENNVSEETTLAISPAFTDLYDQANEWKIKANEYLNNTEFTAEEKAKECRKGRLALVKIRTSIDKKRKELNEKDQQSITDRNNAAKVLTGLVTPLETLLEEVEKKQENEEKERKTQLKNERLENLKPFGVDCTFFDLENMPNEAFAVLLENSSLAHQKRIDDENKIAEEKAFQEKIQKRKDELTILGFTTKNGIDFTCEICDVEGEEIHNLTDEKWKIHLQKISDEQFEQIKIKEAEKKAADDKLKAEADEAKRKNLLLEQQEKERKVKHDTAISRQQEFAKIGINIEYAIVHEMSEESFDNLFKEKNSEYQAEENKKFIEKKKKEREDALKKAEDDKKAEEERLALLAPDKEKLVIFFESVYNTVKQFEANEFKDPEAERIYKNYFSMMERANQWAEEKINTLK